MRRIIFAGVLLVLSLPTFSAQGPATYQVEVLVFRNLSPELTDNEQWNRAPDEKQLPKTDAAVLAASINDPRSDLSGIRDKLNSSGLYEILSHKRWVQNADTKSASQLMRITEQNSPLDGTVQFYMSRFLHLDVELVLTEPASLTSVSITGPISLGGVNSEQQENNTGQNQHLFLINEHRKIRTTDLNYFDHPRFGALVVVTQLQRSMQ